MSVPFQIMILTSHGPYCHGRWIADIDDLSCLCAFVRGFLVMMGLHGLVDLCEAELRCDMSVIEGRQ